MNKQQLHTWMQDMSTLIDQHQDELSELDHAVGDGDHGVNMSRGFKAVVTELEELKEDSISAMMKKIGSTLVSKVGGASGPLFGTAFMRMGAAFQSDEDDWAAALRQAADGIGKRGKATPGESTLLDVFDAVAAVVADHGTDWPKMEEAAEKAMTATKEMESKRGRGALLGERSIGHLDPGAVSSYYLFHALTRTMKGADA